MYLGGEDTLQSMLASDGELAAAESVVGGSRSGKARLGKCNNPISR